VGLLVADRVYQDHGHTLTITSICDSTHASGSLHYKGCAFDCRTAAAGIMQEEADKLKDTLAMALGSEWDVVLEADHLHCEWDPKQGA
jgi:hypothetical protein